MTGHDEPVNDQLRRDHIFYMGMASASTLLVFAGFSRTYYLKSYFQTPVLPVLAHIHGLVFTIWTLFFLSQVVLVAARRTRYIVGSGSSEACSPALWSSWEHT